MIVVIAIAGIAFYFGLALFFVKLLRASWNERELPPHEEDE